MAQPLPPPSEVIRPRQETAPTSEPLLEDQLAPLPQIPGGVASPRAQPALPDGVPTVLEIRRILFEGNTAFASEDLEAIVRDTLPPEAPSVADVYWAAERVALHYEAEGYPTTGALPYLLADDQGTLTGEVLFLVVEGRIEDISIAGTQRLKPDYVRSRLALATESPLNTSKLLEALQLLHSDPAIAQVQARLEAGTELGSNILAVEVQEAETFATNLSVDNQRSPSVGTIQQGVTLRESNLLGLGDRLAVGYSGTDGSTGFSASYTLPINPHQGTVTLSYSQTDSDIIAENVEILDINSESDYFDLTWRQPLVRTPREELAIGVTGSIVHNQTVFGEGIFGSPIGFPVPGADADGKSQVTALRFFQDWVSRTEVDAVAVRSQFSVGLGGLLGGTVNETAPDNNFFSWQGQAQYRRRLAPDTFLLLNGNLQLASRPLLSAEQFSLGGRSTVRGYRQNLLLTDNGAFASAEAWVPVARVPQVDGLLQVTPFVDIGAAWNAEGAALDPGELASVGLGLQWQQDLFSARVDWGIPLVDVSNDGNSLQENGIHFSFSISPR